MFISILFFFNDTTTTEIYTLSLHDALPILPGPTCESAAVQMMHAHVETINNFFFAAVASAIAPTTGAEITINRHDTRSEEHTSELQSQFHLVCRLLLEKKKKKKNKYQKQNK